MGTRHKRDSPSVATTLEVEVQLEDSSVEPALEAMPFRHLPLFVHDSKGDVFIRHTRTETNRQRVRCTVLLQVELRCACLISQVWKEDVELVALYDFGRWVL